MLHPAQHFTRCTLHRSYISKVIIYSFGVLLSQFWTSPLFPVWFCCFLSCIQVSQEAGQVVWYYHLFQNFPQFIVIHTVKGFNIVNKAEIDVFLELPCFFSDPADVGNLISDSSACSKTNYLLSPIKVVLSAYLRLLIFLPAILIPACESSSLAFQMIYSAYKLNKQGDNIQPWLTSFPTGNQSIVSCPILLLLVLHTGFLGDM